MKKLLGKQEDWVILLYYKYLPIKYPQQFAREHLKLCKSLNLKGRIIVAKEGLNGTVGGTKKATNAHKRIMHKDPRFKGMEFKIGFGDSSTFKKMFVRPRKEIVTLGLRKNIDPNVDTGIYLKPSQLQKMLDRKEEVILVDARNNYESAIGKFKNAITPDIRVFKEFPKIVAQLRKYKEKKIVTYCTGGIRCEKASALLKKRGFKNVYQLEGGIIKYGQKYPDAYYEGRCFVFDGRMSIPINTPGKEKIIAQCLHCKTSCDFYVNCCNANCNKLFICCKKCRTRWNDGCSEKCSEMPRASSIQYTSAR